MSSPAPRIVFVGAGAIGGYAGALLARAGNDVTLVDGWPEHVEKIRRDGFAIDGMTPEESVVVPVRALHICDVPQLSKERPFDIAVIAMKSYDTEWAAHLIKPYVAPGGYFVSMQNSINSSATSPGGVRDGATRLATTPPWETAATPGRWQARRPTATGRCRGCR